jgi:ATP-dependent Lon protease
VSALTGIPVRGDVAMTGEITLRGEVTAIGGLKEKLLAAARRHQDVLIPEENAKDLQDIPENVKNGLEIVPVRWIDKVLEVALVRMPVPLTEEEIAASAGCHPPMSGSGGHTLPTSDGRSSIEQLEHRVSRECQK